MNNSANRITQAELKEMLHYNPDSGVFTWIKPSKFNRRVKVGDVAGCPNNKGYLLLQLNGKKYSLHRLAHLYMTGKFPEKSIDHINQRRNDNRWCNLRAATTRQNATNKKNNSLHGVGVHSNGNNKRNPYTAQYNVGNEQYHVGSFDCPIVAYVTRLLTMQSNSVPLGIL